jgi:hypothetical protein
MLLCERAGVLKCANQVIESKDDNCNIHCFDSCMFSISGVCPGLIRGRRYSHFSRLLRRQNYVKVL